MGREREQYWFERLRLALGDELSGAATKCETPDFLVERSGITVGVELTEFQRPTSRTPRREVAAFRKKTVDEARELLGADAPPNIRVVVRFDEGSGNVRTDRAALSRQIAEAVRRHAAGAAREYETFEVPWDEVPDLLTEIEITRLPSHIEGLWVNPDHQWESTVDGGEVVQQILRKKVQLVAAKEKCERLWLVIVNDPFTDGEAVRLGETVREVPSGVPLDRLYWLDPVAPRAIRLH